MKRPVALLTAVLAVHVACSYFSRVIGRVSGDDGGTTVACSVKVFEGTWEEDTCRVHRTPAAEQQHAITLGGRFECTVNSNVDRVYELQVACPGYQTLVRDFPVESCAGSFFRACEDVDVGTLVMTRTR